MNNQHFDNEKSLQKVFKLDNIIYVPHYKNNQVFVGPGYGQHHKNMYSEDDLLSAGASVESMYLWNRTISLTPRERL